MKTRSGPWSPGRQTFRDVTGRAPCAAHQRHFAALPTTTIITRAARSLARRLVRLCVRPPARQPVRQAEVNLTGRCWSMATLERSGAPPARISTRLAEAEQSRGRCRTWLKPGEASAISRKLTERA